MINGFGAPYRLDRDPAVAGKSLGGGVCLYVNTNGCKTVVVRKSVCTEDVELLSASLRPFYLPREFPQFFFYFSKKACVQGQKGFDGTCW